ncbi:tetratricopeptide repeat protein [Pseudohalioglobus lutimaris]|uniref:Uncharacterized protein n=1 Tax=Pseudohalioglobus lutimaris TaxID=1737061 RepID=A0A2N5X389_9GAMM|nr:TRAP transporter TatT component family protein [Pseudohalioglobus lutimaris]PLW68966.1 hypothetical protein C0039_10115 [Pseudohalioglobus lutimaris]
MCLNRNYRPILAVVLLSLSPLLAASSLSETIQQDWDQANFGLAGDARKAALEELVETCVEAAARQPDDAELLTWCGIANSSYAGLASSFSAMKYARAARAMLEKAIDLSPNTLHGAASTSLGTLYFKVPGWPIGFGDNDKASELLKAGLALNPEGIDANYFYADYLLDQGDSAGARQYLESALEAPKRPGRELADEARRKEIEALLADIDGQ